MSFVCRLSVQSPPEPAMFYLVFSSVGPCIAFHLREHSNNFVYPHSKSLRAQNACKISGKIGALNANVLTKKFSNQSRFSSPWNESSEHGSDDMDLQLESSGPGNDDHVHVRDNNVEQGEYLIYHVPPCFRASTHVKAWHDGILHLEHAKNTSAFVWVWVKQPDLKSGGAAQFLWSFNRIKCFYFLLPGLPTA